MIPHTKARKAFNFILNSTEKRGAQTTIYPLDFYTCLDLLDYMQSLRPDKMMARRLQGRDFIQVIHQISFQVQDLQSLRRGPDSTRGELYTFLSENKCFFVDKKMYV